MVWEVSEHMRRRMTRNRKVRTRMERECTMARTTSATIAPQVQAGPLSQEELDLMNAYWRAANYLSVGQIYLYANPLLREPLTLEDIKPRLLGHFGTTPGLNFIYVHCNR